MAHFATKHEPIESSPTSGPRALSSYGMDLLEVFIITGWATPISPAFLILLVQNEVIKGASFERCRRNSFAVITDFVRSLYY